MSRTEVPTCHTAPVRGRARRGAAAALIMTALGAAGCGPAPHAVPAPAPAQEHCPKASGAGVRAAGFVNPAVPRGGLFPAPGGHPPAGAPALSLRVRAQNLVVTYGQPLEQGSRLLHDQMITGRASGGWETVPLAAGYTFNLFGPAVAVFGVVPGPLATGRRAAGRKYAWLVTQWTAVQTLTLMQGTAALAATPDWRQVPPGVDAANLKRAAAAVSADVAAGWRTVGTFAAAPACGTFADNLGPFGARAAIRLPLGVPLRLVSPQFGSITFTVTDG